MIVVGYSYSYMIAKFPVAGGEFAYAYKGFGRTASYICGWMLSLGYLSIVALNATALPVLASYLFPGVFNRGYLYTIAGYDVYMGCCVRNGDIFALYFLSAAVSYFEMNFRIISMTMSLLAQLR